MGFDMYLKTGEVPGEAEAMTQARQKYHEALAERDAIKDQSGTWLTDEEMALPEEERNTIGKAHLDEVDRLVKEEGEDFWIARMRAGSAPPTEEYLKRYQAVLAASEEQDTARKSYFRLNIWGMSTCFDIMNELGMLKGGEKGRTMDWPTGERFGLDEDVREFFDEVWYTLDRPDRIADDFARFKALVTSDEHKDGETPDFTDLHISGYLKYRRATDEKLSAHDESIPGIACNKFDSNDGWWVTKEECATALELWEKNDKETRNKILVKHSWWTGWLEFLRNGAAGQGFTVH